MSRSRFFQCRDCGVDVTWATSRKGNRYLAVQRNWHGDFASRTYYPAHRCTPDPEWRERHAEAQAAGVAAAQREGRIEVGVVVDVVKGRKVPIGTRATVVWIGEDHYNPDSKRLALEVDGERQYTSSSNVEVAPVEEVCNA